MNTRKVICDFQNPLEYFDNDYIFTKDVLLFVILPLVNESLMKLTKSGFPIFPIYQLLVAKKIDAKESFQMTRKLRQTIVNKFKQFCEHCTLHGVYYFCQNYSFWLHSIWIIIIGSSMCLCAYLSHMIWLKFVDNPTFTVVESTHYSIDRISFPAVSICDSKMVYVPNADNITGILNLRGYDQETINTFFSSFDDVKNNNYAPENYIKKMHMVLEHLGYTYDILLDQLSTPCHILIRKCMWRSKAVECYRMFRKVFTVMGYCCQFDMTYFRTHAEKNTKFEAGEEVSEALDVTVNTQIKVANGSFVDSFLYLYVFDPQNKLTLLDSSITLTRAASFDVTVAVSTIDSSENVKSLSLTNRMCFLSVPGIPSRCSLYRLKYYETVDKLSSPKQKYDPSKQDIDLIICMETKKDADYYQGCITLYIMQKVVSHCRCLPFNYESPDLDVEDFPPCTWEKIKCIYYMLDQVQSHIRYIISEHECYQKCDYVQYETKTSYVNIDGDIDDESRVTVHYADSTCIKYRREVLYTWDQMIANLGGIFGLCFGGSIVSIIELWWFSLELLFFVIGLQRKKVTPNTGKEPAVFILKNIEFPNKINNKYPYFN